MSALQTMFFSVVIPTCNRPELLALCLEKLAPDTQTLPRSEYEVVVTDDSADNESEHLVRQKFPWATWVQGPKKGPAANRNFGAATASGEWVVFTDDDCLPAPEWLLAYFQAIQAEPSIKVFEGQTAPVGVRQRLDEEAPINTTGGYLWSCNMCVSRALFQKLGGFDSNFPGAAMEDVEFYERLKVSGQQTFYVPAATVAHPWRPRKKGKFLDVHAQSVVYFLKKHPHRSRDFSKKTLLINLARSIFKHGLWKGRALRWRGLVRHVAIECVYAAKLINNLEANALSRNIKF